MGGGGRGQTKFIVGKMKMVSEAIKTRCKAREDASFELAKKVNFLDLFSFFFNNLKQELIKFDGLLS